MATVIDALVVEFGLDPSTFTKGQKKAIQDVKGLEDQVDKSGKNIQHTVNGVRNQVMSMMAAFLAGRGLKEFIQDMVQAEAEAARLAKVLDTIPSELSAWGGAATMTGGSTNGLAGSVQNLVSQFQQFSLTGESSVIPWFRALQVNITDLDTGKMRDFGSILLDLADRFHGMDPARASAFGKQLGLDQGTINLLIQGRAAVQAMLAEQKRLGVMMEDDAAAGLALQHSWLALQQSSTSMGRTLLTDVAGPLVKVLDVLTNVAVWVRGHKPLMQAFFASLSVAAVGLTIAFAPVTATVLGIAAAVAIASTAIGLLYDDWKVWTEGGKSAFGSFWQFFADKWNGIKDTVLPAIQAIWKTMQDWFAVVIDGVKLILALFTGSGDDIRAAWGKLFQDLGTYIWDWVDLVKKIGPALLAAFKAAFGMAFDWAKGRAKAIWDAIRGHSDAPAPGGGKPAPAPPGGAPSKDAAWAAAVASEKKYGIPAAVTMAQYQLESANGTRMPAGSNNPFGIKAKPGQDYVEATTKEFIHGQMITVKRKFAKFGSLAEAFDEHAKLLANSKHYAKARATTSAGDFADALTGVYATDPNYGTKLKSLMASNSKGGGNTSTTSHQTKIEKVIVQTQATDAPGIARDIRPAIERDAFATQANAAAA